VGISIPTVDLGQFLGSHVFTGTKRVGYRKARGTQHPSQERHKQRNTVRLPCEHNLFPGVYPKPAGAGDPQMLLDAIGLDKQVRSISQSEDTYLIR
jgi:hypothetical protein